MMKLSVSAITKAKPFSRYCSTKNIDKTIYPVLFDDWLIQFWSILVENNVLNIFNIVFIEGDWESCKICTNGVIFFSFDEYYYYAWGIHANSSMCIILRVYEHMNMNVLE